VVYESSQTHLGNHRQLAGDRLSYKTARRESREGKSRPGRNRHVDKNELEGQSTNSHSTEGMVPPQQGMTLLIRLRSDTNLPLNFSAVERSVTYLLPANDTLYSDPQQCINFGRRQLSPWFKGYYPGHVVLSRVTTCPQVPCSLGKLSQSPNWGINAPKSLADRGTIPYSMGTN